MDIYQIQKIWTEAGEQLNTYKPSQLDNPLLLETTRNFLVECGLPESCAPCLSFDKCSEATIQTPNQVFNIDIRELNHYLIIGSNGSGDPISIDLEKGNEIVYLNHDNSFERVYMNGSVHQLAECIIRYRDFYGSLDPRFENNILMKRKFSNEEFLNVCDDFRAIDAVCLLENNCWKAELEYLLWERDNE